MRKFLVELLFPRFCVSCGKFGKYICQDCAQKIDYFHPPAGGQVCPYCERASPYGLTHPRCTKRFGLDGMFVLAHYRGPIIKLIKAIKYRQTFAASAEAAGLIAQAYHGQFHFNFLVPVPLSAKREQTRGFNQAEKLSVELQKQLNTPSVNLLQRIKDTKPQFDLKFQARKENMLGAFALKNNVLPDKIKGQSFCLVDDVATTGATIFECAKVLKKAGADRVFALTIARGG